MKKLLFVLAAMSALSLISCSDDSSSSSVPSANLPASVGTNELAGLNLTYGSDSSVVFEDNKVTYTDDGYGQVFKYTYNSEKKEIYLSVIGVVQDGLTMPVSQVLGMYSMNGASQQTINDISRQLKIYVILSYKKNDTTVTFTPVFDGTLDSVSEIFDCRFEFENDVEKNYFSNAGIYFDGHEYQGFPNFSKTTFSGNIYETETVPVLSGTFSGSYVLDNESATPTLTLTYDTIVSKEAKLTAYQGKTVVLDLYYTPCTYNIVTE